MSQASKKRRSADAPTVLDGPGLAKDIVDRLVTRQKSTPPQIDESEGEDEDDIPKKRLRFVDVLTEVPNGDAEAATELALTGRELTEAESLESCRNLKKIELKDNKLSDLNFLEMNHQLCWIGAAKNRVARLTGLGNLHSLAVLDLSDNRLVRLEGLSGLSGLKALIVARNRIKSIDGLSPKKNPLLETLVLSHNQISECHLAPFKALKKLSLANNQLHAFPGLPVLAELTELRLNGNRISTLTQQLQQPRLSILDIGNNLLAKVEAIEAVRGLLWIKSLNLFGNPVAQDMEDKLMKGILATLPKLEIVNNRRLEGTAAKTSAQKNKGRQRSKGHSADFTKSGLGAANNNGHDGRWGSASKGAERGTGWQENQPARETVVKKKKRKGQPAQAQAVVDASSQVKKKKKKRKFSPTDTGAAVVAPAQQETARPLLNKKGKKVKRKKDAT